MTTTTICGSGNMLRGSRIRLSFLEQNQERKLTNNLNRYLEVFSIDDSRCSFLSILLLKGIIQSPTMSYMSIYVVINSVIKRLVFYSSVFFYNSMINHKC